MAIRRLLALALVSAALLAFPVAASAATPIAVEVITGYECISGTGAANKQVTVTLRTPGGHVRGRFSAETGPGGNWGGCFLAPVNGGDQLRVKVGNKARSISIPRMEPRIDRVANTIEGFARAADDVVFAEILHSVTFNSNTSHVLAVQADADGHYEFNTTGEVNLRGGDTVIVFGPHGDDSFGAFVLVPHVNVLHANNLITGTANDGSQLTFELRNNRGKVKASITAGTAPIIFGISIFSVSMYKSNGNAVYPVATDRLESNLATDAVLRMPHSSLEGNPANDVVNGQCMKNAPYVLQVENELFFGKTNSNGRFQRDITNRMNLRRGDFMLLTCMYSTGDTWARSNIAR